jgi:lipopolysaccharide biosynthesis protein
MEERRPVAVFVHIHYPDIWREMAPLIAERFDAPFQLIVTTSRPLGSIEMPRSPWLRSTHALAVENRGRDVLPFLRAIADTPDFEFGLKLHTKKSPQRQDGDAWRRELLDALLPPIGAEAVLTCMAADPRVGLVTPGRFCLSVRPWVLENETGMRRIFGALGAELDEAAMAHAYFAAGSMFWFRRDAVAALTAPAIGDLFEPETGQLDGTVAHAMERIFPLAAKRRGLVSLALPALLASDPAMTREQLVTLAQEHADISSRFFPGPYIAALPPEQRPARRRSPWRLLTALYRANVPVGFRRAARRLLGR